MIIKDLIRLIQSLSTVEKRHFQLKIGDSKKKTNYYILYDFIQSNSQQDTISIIREFGELHPTVALESTALYLIRLLGDHLLQFRIEQDDWYRQLYGLMMTRLFFERSIDRRALFELGKVKTLAEQAQQHELLQVALRMELSYLSTTNFEDMSEQDLIDIQMKSKSSILHSKQLHEHYSLYELLQHRLLSGEIVKDSKMTQDLLLAELSLSVRGSKNQFSLQKLHLLFQSFFFIHTGDYHSALKIFQQLNDLFDSHKQQWNSPPYDYLSTLDGILDSLRSIGYHREMNKYLLTLNTFCLQNHPEHFLSLVRLSHLNFSLTMHIGNKDAHSALQLLQQIQQHPPLFDVHAIDDKVLEYTLLCSIVAFMHKDYRAAKNKLIQQGHLHLGTKSFLCRVMRILNLIITYEQKDHEHLDYEIRAFKRTFAKRDKLYKSEKLLFQTIKDDVRSRGNHWKQMKLKKLADHFNSIRADKNERQINKYYNFADWIAEQYQVK